MRKYEVCFYRRCGHVWLKNHIWDKVVKNEPTKIYGREPLSRSYHFKFFKDCLSQILFGPFLNTFFHLMLKNKIFPNNYLIHIKEVTLLEEFLNM